MTYGVTPEGFVKKPLEQIKEDVATRLRASPLGAALTLTAESGVGQMHQILCEEIAQVWEVQEAEHKAWDPDANGGESQDNVAAITGTIREDARASTVDVSVTTDQAVSIAAGDLVVSVDGNTAARFQNAEAIVTAGAETVAAPFVAQETGPIVANAGTLTEIETPTVGVVSVTNPLDAELGADIEDDEDLRLRREEEIDAVGAGTLDSIRARLLKVTGVTEAEVFENVDDNDDVDGRPPGCIHGVVIGGADDDIAQALWDTKGGGIKAHGSDSGTAVDEKGRERTVAFDRADELEVWIEIDVDIIEDDYPADGDDQLIAAIVTQGDALRMGADVIAEKLQAIAFATSGVYDLTGFRLGLAASPVGTSNLSVDDDEKAVFDSSRVLVTTNPVTP